MNTSPIRMLSWGARLLYAGPSIDLSWHANGVGEFSLALDGEIDVQREDGDAFTARSVFVPAGASHRMTFRCATIACLYVDVSAADGALLLRAMSDQGAGYAASHRAEAAIAEAIQAFLADQIAPKERKARLADVFGLKPLVVVDSKMAAALRAIHAAPDRVHRVATLARSLSLSESQFRKAFRAATGVTLKRYRVWARLTAAMGMAQRGESLTAAAHGAGFSSSAHFSVAYRNMFGMTPSAFLELLASAGPAAGPAHKVPAPMGVTPSS